MSASGLKVRKGDNLNDDGIKLLVLLLALAAVVMLPLDMLGWARRNGIEGEEFKAMRVQVKV